MIEKIQWIRILEEIKKYKMVNDESVESIEILEWYLQIIYNIYGATMKMANWNLE